MVMAFFLLGVDGIIDTTKTRLLGVGMNCLLVQRTPVGEHRGMQSVGVGK